ncbi:hypothetical protein C1645_807460 [Glomus cerebriforme]|uniref:Uncharacterized protein n=1 Tax=Glomus cerebriforme TaxID=658196 RepID=A0A397SSX2_9GLOM|nr:hypothetical protein C1645_807460 [Glomus cerebriforme]
MDISDADINLILDATDGVGHVWEGVDDNTIPDMIIKASWMVSEKYIDRMNDDIVIDMGHIRALLMIKTLACIDENVLLSLEKASHCRGARGHEDKRRGMATAALKAQAQAAK